MEKEKEGQTIVVRELPVVSVRNAVDEEKVTHPVMTMEEAIAEILEDVRKIKNAVAK